MDGNHNMLLPWAARPDHSFGRRNGACPVTPRSPISLLRHLWFYAKEKVFLAAHPDRQSRFSAVYRRNLWKNPESASGYGSTASATQATRAGLEALIAEGGIGSITDAPCGDFNWMGLLAFDGLYQGCDIVPELIAANTAAHGTDRRSFAVVDIVAETPPAADLVMCRECLNHISLADANAAVDHLAAAAGRWLAITHYPDTTVNADQPSSFRFRPLNLTLAPFGLRAPDRVIEEREVGSSPDKVLGLWDTTKGPVRA